MVQFESREKPMVESRENSMVESEGRDELSFPLLPDVASSSASEFIPNHSHATVKRTGTVWTAVAHIINGVIGSGVLSLAWSVAQLGWIVGPLMIVVFGIITVISSNLLCDCYRYPHPEVGHVRNRSYAKAVRSYLGRKSMWVVGIFIHESFYGFGIAFTITAAISMRAILRSNCYHKEGHDAPCEYGDAKFMLVYGAVQMLLAQIPDLQETEFLSMIAAVMSFAYAAIGLGLGVAKTIGNGEIKGDFRGVPAVSLAQKAFLSFQAVGDIAFSYNYNIILLDIQDTLKEPQENRKMKKAVNIGIFITSFFFLCCGCFGYAAFGNEAPGNLLTGFGFYEPYWLVDIANACIVIHLMGGYPIYSQPLFAAVERKFRKYHPESKFVNNEYIIKLPLLPRFRLNLLRLCFRTTYVASTTGIAILFPYFNQVLGVLGALNFWPVMIYFPVQMYLKQNDVRSWSPMWIFLQALKVSCLICCILAFIGSVEGLISSKLS